MATTGHEQEIIDVAGLKASLKKGGNKAVYNEAICSTAGATAAKVTNTTPPSFSLVSGATIIVKFTYAISVANATLKVGDADAKPIYYRGAALEANKVKAGDKVLLRYDGTSFNIIGSLGETYENKQAASGGTDVSLVTTGEKYAWNQKQDAITFNTAYNASTNKAATMADITKANVSLENVTNNAQVKGLASGTTEDHVVVFGSDGYTVKDSGKTIGKSVPADAVFTDTTYESKTAASGGTDVSLVTTGEKYTWNNKTSPIINTTWAALKSLRDNSQLVPGQWYRITDYECTTAVSNTQSAGHVFDIIVRADDVNVLNENAYAAHHAGDIYFANSNLAAWKLRYTIDNVNWSSNGGKVALLANGASLQYIGNTKQIQGQTWYTWLNTNPGYPWGNTFYTLSQSPSSGDIVMGYAMGTFNQYSTISSVTMPSEGKGTILKMIDEHNNECHYDFKNIQFKVGANSNSGTVADVFYYTFSAVSGTNDATVTDHSLNGLYCYNNRIGKYIKSSVQTSNFNVFRNTSTTSYCYNNTFGHDCYSNTFGNSCRSNRFGNNCYYNTFGNSCRSNTFGHDCYSNTFGYDCYSNTFGNGCYSNTFGNGCRFNRFGNNCNYNTFGNNCNYNTFGNGCYSNTFGNGCYYNTFGNGCYSNTFGNGCYYNTFGMTCYYNTFGNNCNSNTFGMTCSNNTISKDYCRFIIIESGNYNITLISTQTTSSSNYLQNIKICQGVRNTGAIKIISHNTVNDTFLTEYKPINSQVISV